MTYKITLDEMERCYGSVWRFDTARYTVAMWADEEYLDPADSFCDERDVEFARQGGAHWFCAFVGVFKTDDRGDAVLIGRDVLGGCSYNSFTEFCGAHRWQYSRNQSRWIKDPKSPAWKACEARRPRRSDGSRADGHHFPSMVRQALSEARSHEIRLTMVAS